MNLINYYYIPLHLPAIHEGPTPQVPQVGPRGPKILNPALVLTVIFFNLCSVIGLVINSSLVKNLVILKVIYSNGLLARLSKIDKPSSIRVHRLFCTLRYDKNI